MTALAPADKEQQKAARARAGRIRMGIRSYIHTLGDIRTAWVEGDWKTLGYSTWDAYVSKEFGADQVKLPPEQRKKAIEELRLADMPNRAIAAAINVDEKTVRRVDAAANAAVIEGEIVDPPAETQIVDAMKQAIDDAQERAEDHRDRQPGDTDATPPASVADNPGGLDTPSDEESAAGEVGRSRQGQVPTSPVYESGSGVTSPTPDPEQERTDGEPACEACKGALLPEHAELGYMRCETCDPMGDHLRDADGNCRVCVPSICATCGQPWPT